MTQGVCQNTQDVWVLDKDMAIIARKYWHGFCEYVNLDNYKKEVLMRNNLKRRVLAALLGAAILGSNTVLAAEQSLGLKAILSEAIQKNPTIIEAEKNWQVETNKIRPAKTLPNPKFGIMKDDIPAGTLNPQEGMMTSYTLSQEFMYPGKLSLMGKMAENGANMGRTDYLEKKLQVYTETKQAYYDALYASKALTIERENQQLMGQLVQITQVNYSTGMVPLQDALKAQTEYSQMTTDLLNMAAMESVAKSKINALMGKNPSESLQLAEEFPTPPPNFNLESMQKQALATKPALKGMEYKVAMAQNGVDLAKKQRRPDFELNYQFNDQKPDAMGEDTDTWSVELMAMFPIWGGKNNAEINGAKANLGSAQASLESMKNMTQLDVQMALTKAQSSWRQIELYQQNIIPQAEQTYQASMVSYTNGKVDVMTVLENLRALRNAKLAHYKAKIDYEMAIAELEKAVGKPMFSGISF
jgi:outer membrane protein, heavy metal efflux system